MNALSFSVSSWRMRNGARARTPIVILDSGGWVWDFWNLYPGAE